jgi:hypothetical protein
VRTLAIEITDAGLVVVDESGIVCSEPGFAVVRTKETLTGFEAFAEARLRPRATSFSHWSTLSIEPGSAAVSRARSTAELAHAQLKKLWEKVGKDVDHVVFVVPSTFQSDALGILLGLAEECGIPTGAIVDAAVASSVRPYPEQQLVYVDADLHGIYVTNLEQGERVTAESPDRLDSVGLNGVMDALARRIGELFVLETRFDPFHEARTEQQIYDGLSRVLSQLGRDGNAALELTRGDETFRVEFEESQILAPAQGFYRAVRQLIAQNRRSGSDLVVQLSHRLVSLPGIDTELARLDATTVVDLEPGHAPRSVLEAIDALDLASESVIFYRHMPWRGQPVQLQSNVSPAPKAASPARGDSQRPTHVVYRGIAYPVNGEGVVIGRSKLDHRRAIVVDVETQGVSRAHCELSVVDGELRLRDLSSYGTFVNERRIAGDEILKPADIIRVGSPGAELVAICVQDPDGA